ncbi:unnamed protein product [Cylicocyclus nassatus]|uniref:RING-type E3 ubiquitin transferase BRCA1 n=1 Tax=Cylicocyclus nassatus TaxID=53992 RepID=A0AA36GVA0_CYLNA|nr:unnamed protein product [Cylicocyclus nassatus]
MSVSNSGYEVALKINAVLTRIQAELKCGVCRSTFSNPVAANCGHTFCEECVNQVFERRRFVECPLCREKMNKRSCTTSEQLDALVKGYLQLGKVFRTEVQTQTISIPQELAYMESQIPAAPVSDSPLRDFRPPEPHFALPKARARRKQPLSVHNPKQQKMDTISEESEAKENVDLLRTKETENNEVHPVKKSILARRSETDLLRYARSKTVEVQCDLPNPSCVCRNLRGALASFKDINQKLDYPSDLHALFAMVPEYKQILEENLPALYELVPFPQSTSNTACVLPQAENCEIAASVKIDLDAVSDDVCEDDLCETQPSPFVLEADSRNCVKTALQNVEKMSPCCSRSSGGVVPQSSTDDDDEDEMEITLHGNFESFPIESEACKPGPTDIAAEVSSPIFISVSRMSCIEDEKLLQEFLALFPNVHYSEELTVKTTHLVMMNSQQSCERRSLRYVYAVARKCEILSRCWLEECTNSKRLLPTEKYGLSSELTSETPGWLRAKSSTKQLFEKTKFFLPQSFSESKHLPLESLKELISLCGGDCCEKPWEVAGAHKAYTIFKPKSSNWNEAQRYEASMQGVPVLVADWILDSIAEFRLMPIDAYKVRHR